MTKRKSTLILVVVAVAAVVLLAAAGVVVLGGGAAWFLVRDGSGPGSSAETETSRITGIVALGGGGALFIRGSAIAAQLVVARANLTGSDVREAWQWQAPRGYGTDPMLWRHGRRVGRARAASLPRGEPVACCARGARPSIVRGSRLRRPPPD